jgi:hypothetical protein
VSKLQLSLSLILVTVSSLYAERLRIDPRYDFAKLSYEHAWDLPLDSTFKGSSPRLDNVWLYAGLPGIKIGPRYLFSSIEADLVVRSLSSNGNENDRSFMQRYGLFTGYPVIEAKKHNGALMVGAGIASDMSVISSRDLFVNLIYDHTFTISPELKIGMGLLISYNLGGFKKTNPFNLLPTIDWKPNNWFGVDVRWDHASLKFYLHDRFALVSETRYDLSYYNLEEYSYQYETVATGVGVDIAIGKSLLLRSRVLKGLYRREISWDDTNDYIITSGPSDAGMSFRTELSYLR